MTKRATTDRILDLLAHFGGTFDCRPGGFVEEAVAAALKVEVSTVTAALTELRERGKVRWEREKVELASAPRTKRAGGAALDAQILRLLQRHGGEMRDSEGGVAARIARELGGVGKDQMWRAMQRLEAAGLIVRKLRSPMRGTVMVRLTRKGKAA